DARRPGATPWLPGFFSTVSYRTRRKDLSVAKSNMSKNAGEQSPTPPPEPRGSGGPLPAERVGLAPQPGHATPTPGGPPTRSAGTPDSSPHTTTTTDREVPGVPTPDERAEGQDHKAVSQEGHGPGPSTRQPEGQPGKCAFCKRPVPPCLVEHALLPVCRSCATSVL